MRVALVGAGRIGTKHARLLATLEGVDQLLVTDLDTDRARALAVEVGATDSPSVETALAEADALVVAVATDAHAAVVRAGLARGIPIFCEKPLSGDLAQSIQLAREVEASGVPFQLGFQRRFDPGYAEARRLVADGELGTVYVARLAGHDPAPPHEAYIPASGGLFRDFSVHDFDIIRWLLAAEVDEVYADGAVRGFPVFAKYGDVDSAVATLRMDNGVLVAMTVARHDPLGYDIRAELFGSRDSISVGLGPNTPMRSVEPGVPPPAGPAWPDFATRFDEAYRAELVGFVRIISEGLPSPCTARDGVQAERIAEAATRSLHEHRPVPLSEIPG